jgi:predicted pyridoxine 5'-phosphate oxidase superfamily flavin-nucleotide-binding protein
MSPFYSDAARRFQDAFDTRRLADRFEQTIVRDAATDDDRAFIESRDFFFLATVDAEGWPQCSYKGGPPGLVRLLGPRELAFPSYDGNGMFLSMGNAATTGRIAMLFVDFEAPKRLRLQGRAAIDPEDTLRSAWPGADLVVRVAIERIWPNCPRYIHRHQRLESSPYVPTARSEPPVPAWKTFEFVRDVLPARDQAAVAAAVAAAASADERDPD